MRAWLAAAALILAPLGAHAAGKASDVPAITPAGITVFALGDVRGKDGVLRVANNRRITDVYADHRGMTLYTYSGDKAGVSACTGECARKWTALAPLPGAQPGGSWTLIAHGAAGKQWAYKGKPVYTHAADTQRGEELKGDALENGAWQVIKPQLSASGEYPFGIAARGVADAGGEVLVDYEGMTLYAYAGDLAQEKVSCHAAPCAGKWIILTAPAVANAQGDFSVAVRPDGTRQWAHRGRPLYRYSGDVLPEDVNGIGADKRFSPALVVKYPMPAEVAIRSTPSNGKAFATAKGMTLYRYAFFQRVQSTDELRAGPYLTAVAQELGTRACTGTCLTTWRPLLASKKAQPSWHWTLLDRGDGTQQWAYRGHPLYTYAGDNAPGDINGLNSWDAAINDRDLGVVGTMTKINADNQLPSSFYWTTAYP